MGRFEMDTWYYSPFPEPYCNHHTLYVCEFCLKYFRKGKTLVQHERRCPHTAPPGRQIYTSPAGMVVGGAVTDPQIAMYEVDGAEAKVYCQNLCLLSKVSRPGALSDPAAPEPQLGCPPRTLRAARCTV